MDYCCDELPPARLELMNAAVRSVLGQMAPTDGEDTASIKAWAGGGAFCKARWSRRLHETAVFVRDFDCVPKKGRGRIEDMSPAVAHEHGLACWLGTNYRDISKIPPER